MSDPNGSGARRAIRWTAWILFVIYPISSGPVCALAELAGWGWLAVPYLPLIWVTGFFPPLRIALMIWIMIWSPRHGRGMIG
jgi:hypothetical protein